MDVTKYRWVIIAASFCIMMIISIYQYSWFLFAYALQKQMGWNLGTIGLAFTVFVYSATFVQPFSGYIADTYGPKKIAVGASVLVGLGMSFCSQASSPQALYLFYGLGGLGVGILYGISAACAVKWFPDRRGFATGVVVFGFGSGTALFNWFIQGLLDLKGTSATFMYTGVFMFITLIPLSFFYAYPSLEHGPRANPQSRCLEEPHEFKPSEMVKTRQWYMIYFSFVATVSIVLMFGAQMKTLAKELSIPRHYFSLVMFLFPLGNGFSRILAGYVSDRVGREKTMMGFYAFLGLSVSCFIWLADVPIFFVAIVFISALLGGAPFALYPATVGDYYGARYSTTNYGLTYTAKAWAGLLSGWLSGYFATQFGSYKIPLVIVAVCSFLAAAVSNPLVMKPPVKR